ncbi:MAG: methionine--tRNA ligase [Alphaproteobacteria bacterium]
MKNAQTAYITTPIYYPSGAPHLGSAYTSLAADVYARFQRLDGKDTYFLTGTDEHGLKLQRKAEEAGVTPQAYVDEMSKQFRTLTPMLNLSNDDFIRTTEERHKAGVQALWLKLQEKGWIYKATYSGWYCVSDEAYYDESELVEGKAPSGHPVEWMEEESYFFKLSAFGDKLLELYKKNPNFIQPESRRNEVVSFVKGGLQDLSISRTTFNWGVPVPNDPKHVMYVWIDALTNYITALGYPNQDAESKWKYWPAIHVVGKDILRFHAVYWPAFLMGAELPVPQQVFAHGWWTSEGKKMSKSFGNVVDPAALTAEFGVDPIRYFLLREVPFGNDGDFVRNRLIGRVNVDLANELGNMFQRVLAMVNKNCNAQVPAMGAMDAEDDTFMELMRAAPAKVRTHMNTLAFHKALETIWEIVIAANVYMDRQAPWQLKKTDEQRMAHVLRVLMEAQRVIAVLLQAFMPEKAAAMLALLGLEATPLSALTTVPALTTGAVLPAPAGLFPRIEAPAA